MNKILLVNDCKLESVIMKDMLNSLGYDVEIADEYSAIVKIKELSPNILICNLVMRETKGNLIIERVKKDFPKIKCFLCSSSEIEPKDFDSYRVDDVIKTPSNVEKLNIALKNNGIQAQANKVANRNLGNEKAKKFHYCPYCGGDLVGYEGSIRFCPMCGEKLS